MDKENLITSFNHNITLSERKNTYQGNITIKGKVNSLTYNDEKAKSKEEGFLGKIFK